MITYTKPTYKCEHCRKLYQIKGACERHEKACFRNPDNKRPCNDCNHCEMIKVDLTVFDHNGYDSQVSIKTLHCDKIKSYLIPPKAEHRGNAYLSEELGDGDTPNVPMPRKCDMHYNGIPEHLSY